MSGKKSPINIIRKLRKDPVTKEKFDLIVAFVQRLPIQNFGEGFMNVYKGNEAVELAHRMKLERNKSDVVKFLEKLFDYGLITDASNVGRFEGSNKVFYGLGIAQNGFDTYIQLYRLKSELIEVKKAFTGKLRKDLFNRILHDVVLMIVERQANLEGILQTERKEYKSLYSKYVDLKKQTNDQFTVTIQELEKDLETEKKKNKAYILNLKNLKGTGTKSPLVGDEIVRLENENETLAKHNEILQQKNMEAKAQTVQFQKVLEQQRKENFELNEKLKTLATKFKEMQQKGGQNPQNSSVPVANNIPKKILVDKNEEDGGLGKLDRLSNQLTSLHEKLAIVQSKGKKGGGGRKGKGSSGAASAQNLVNQYVGSINEKILGIVNEIKE